MNALGKDEVKKRHRKTSMEDYYLTDEVLIEILCRLSCYRTAVRCKTVSKRWYALISDPFFVAKGFSMHRKQTWTLLSLFLTYKPLLQNYILSLNFFPNRPLEVLHTFQDLVLCFSFNHQAKGVFIVCNPLTKQWIALPPSQTHRGYLFKWAGLVGHDKDGCGFRVIVVPPMPPHPSAGVGGQPLIRNINLDIYLSETSEWKKIDVEIPIRPQEEGSSMPSLSAVVCKGMVCMGSERYFGAFNPFDVTPHGTTTTLRAMGLALPKSRGSLLESDGNLFSVNDNYPRLLRLFLSPDVRPFSGLPRRPIYKRVVNFEDGTSEGDKLTELLIRHIKVTEESILAPWGGSDHHYTLLNIHPNIENLVYVMECLPKGDDDDDEEYNYQLIECNTMLRTCKLVKQGLAHQLLGSKELHVSYWPTPITSNQN